MDAAAAPAVAANTVVGDADSLSALAARWPERYSVVLQEYLPPSTSEDWICNAWVGPDPGSSVIFTGRKDRMWPPEAGVATFAEAIDNPEVAGHSSALFEALGYQGIADLDWRLDERDSSYKLLDFNPRIGAQFRLFETEQGIDVVRAAHLTLTGRPRSPAEPPGQG